MSKKVRRLVWGLQDSRLKSGAR